MSDGCCRHSGRSRKRPKWFSSKQLWDINDADDELSFKTKDGLHTEHLFVSGDVKIMPIHPCAVCRDVSTGFHYKCIACEGCKGFFRRTVQKNLAEGYECRTGMNNCKINPENRGRCQACRYAKCLEEGMIGDLVLSSEERLAKQLLINNNRKRKRIGHPINQECDVHDDNDGNERDNDDSSSPDDNSVENVIFSNPSEDFRSTVLRAYNECFLSKAYLDLTSPWNVTSFVDLSVDSTQPFVQLTTTHLTRTANFIEMVPYLKDLPLSDKLMLLGNCGLKIFLVQAARNMASVDFRTKVIEEDEEAAFVYQRMRFLTTYLLRQDFDDTAFAFFATFIISQADECKNLADPHLVAHIRSELENNIVDHSLLSRSIKRNKDDLLIGNCYVARCVPALFGSKHPLLDIVNFQRRPTFQQLYRYFK